MTWTRLAVKASCQPQASTCHEKAMVWLVIAFTWLARDLASLVRASASPPVA